MFRCFILVPLLFLPVRREISSKFSTRFTLLYMQPAFVSVRFSTWFTLFKTVGDDNDIMISCVFESVINLEFRFCAGEARRFAISIEAAMSPFCGM
jgi:hypothetical protein